eukprot:COSAG01_NODE_69_length_28801_cov_10.460038_14_plen_182_part_00
MTLQHSLPLNIGQDMPLFALHDPTGKAFNLEKEESTGTIIIFTCNHCPYAIAIWPRLIKLALWAKRKNINTVAINPNIHPNYPEDKPEAMKEKIKAWQIPFPYLIDSKQEVAKAYQAQCTPDIYLLDKKTKLFYHGELDDNWQNEEQVEKESLKEAVLALIDKKTAPKKQKPSMGCSIKWQ